MLEHHRGASIHGGSREPSPHPAHPSAHPAARVAGDPVTGQPERRRRERRSPARPVVDAGAVVVSVVPGADRRPAAVSLALAIGGLAVHVDLRPDAVGLLELSGRLNQAAESCIDALAGRRP